MIFCKLNVACTQYCFVLPKVWAQLGHCPVYHLLSHLLFHTILSIPFATARSFLLLYLALDCAPSLECHLFYYARLSYTSIMKAYQNALIHFLFCHAFNSGV